MLRRAGNLAGRPRWDPRADVHALARPRVREPAEPTAPGAPNLTAATRRQRSVALSWTRTGLRRRQPDTGYEIWRGTTSGTASLLTTVGLTTTYTDTTVTNGTTYYYRSPRSTPSTPVRARTSAAPRRRHRPTDRARCAEPDRRQRRQRQRGAELEPPASDGGSPITGYEIWRGTTSGTASLLTTVGLTTTYTDTTVSNGTTYYYQVAAVNAVDTGPARTSAAPRRPAGAGQWLGGTSSAFALSNNAGSTSFSLPAGSDRLVAMISLHSTTTLVTSMTWKPDPANPALDQPLTRVGRQVASASGAVEIWELANPTRGRRRGPQPHPGANTKRVLGVHALAGVGGRGAPVGAGVGGTAIAVNVASQPGALVLDVIYGQNSTTAHPPAPDSPSAGT